MYVPCHQEVIKGHIGKGSEERDSGKRDEMRVDTNKDMKKCDADKRE